MKYSAKTIRTLILLSDGEAVNEGECRSRQLKEILDRLKGMNAISFVRKGTSRGVYKAITRERFIAACQDIDRVLADLDAALRLAENDVSTRAEKVSLFGNSKQGGEDRTLKGFTLLADRLLEVSYLGHPFPIGPLAGLHVVDRTSLSLPKEATVLIVENAECFYDHRWIANVGLKESEGPFILLYRSLISEEGKLWLESISNRILYFGDFDLGGIQIYESEFKKRLGDKVSFIVPDDLEERIRRQGNPGLYTKQINDGYANLTSPSGELTGLIERLHRLQSSYEQEGYCM